MMNKPASREEPINGLTQLTLVEHALCPLDAKSSLRAGYCHETTYRYSDKNGDRQTARVRVTCPDGLSANDEFYLWGLLALTFAQPELSPEFHATPHYCLSQLGVIAPESKGGKSYRLFREAIGRLSGIHYENDRFFDPLRKEHRQVRFGLLGYSLPFDEQSNRAWRIVWDAQFLEFCRAAGGALRFDLATYRSLDPASRRLFLLLQKVFYRSRRSPRLGVRQLAVTTLGFSDAQPTSKLRAKIARCSSTLAELGYIQGAPDFVKRGDGGYLQFHRGPRFEQAVPMGLSVRSPLTEPLARIGLDQASVSRVLKNFDHKLIRLWSDIALTAIEQKQKGFFKRSPVAYFIDNLNAASRGERMPPDWFLAVQKQEQRRLAETAKPRDPEITSRPVRAFSTSLSGKQLVDEMTAQFLAAGQAPATAKRNAERFAQAKRSSTRQAKVAN